MSHCMPRDFTEHSDIDFSHNYRCMIELCTGREGLRETESPSDIAWKRATAK